MHNLVNSALGIGSVALTASFLTGGSYYGGIATLLAVTAFSKILGVTLTNAVGKRFYFNQLRWC